MFDTGVTNVVVGGLSGAGNLSLQGVSGSVTLTIGNIGGVAANTTYSGAFSGSGALTKAGSSMLTLLGANSYNGLTTISGGTLEFGNGMMGYDGSLSGTGGISNGTALVYDLAGSETYSGNISGAGSLTKTGNGLLFLSGNNSYSGSTTVSGGTLAVSNSAALTSCVTASKLTVTPSATLLLSVGTGASTWAANDITNLLLNNKNNFAIGSAVGFDTSGGSFSYSGTIGGSMGLTKTGPNMLSLSGSNTYGGPTAVPLGTLEVANVGALPNYSSTGSDYLTVGNGATLALSVGTSTTTWAASNVTSFLSSANTAGFTNGSALGFDTAGGNFSYGLIKGNMGLAKLGANALTLTAANTFTGPTTVTGGTLALSNSGALQNSTVSVPTPGVGSISFAGTSYTFGGLSGAGYLGLQSTAGSAVALTVGGNNSSTTYSGTLNGAGSLTKIGAGALTLAGSNICGGVTVNNGEVAVVGTGTLTTGSGNLVLGRSGPGSMVIQDKAVVQVGGELDVNYYQGAGDRPLVAHAQRRHARRQRIDVHRPRSRVRRPEQPEWRRFIRAAEARNFGQLYVGYRGTATSLYDISSGTARTTGNVHVGFGGNGELDISGNGVVNVVGGLTVGEDSNLATAGLVTLADKGSLSVNGGLTLGNSGGSGTFIRSGGTHMRHQRRSVHRRNRHAGAGRHQRSRGHFDHRLPHAVQQERDAGDCPAEWALEHQRKRWFHTGFDEDERHPWTFRRDSRRPAATLAATT